MIISMWLRRLTPMQKMRAGIATLTAAAVVTMAFPAASAPGDKVPSDLASLARQVYEKSKGQLGNSGPHLRAKSAFDRSRIANWAGSPIAMPGLGKQLADKLGLDLADKDARRQVNLYLQSSPEERRDIVRRLTPGKARQDIERLVSELSTLTEKTVPGTVQHHTVPLGNGETLEVSWRPQDSRVLLRVRSDGSGSAPKYDVTLVGTAAVSADAKSGDARIDVEAPKRAVRTYTEEALDRIQDTVLGEWMERNSGDTYRITAADKSAGDIRPTRAWYNAEIGKLEDRLRQTRNAKEYMWEDSKTGKIVRQTRFRRMQPPFVYKGESFLIEDGEQRVADLQRRIKSLQDERDGRNRPPVESHDPAGYENLRNSRDSRPVTVTVIRRDGHAYVYDHAYFDGRLISARRTYRDIRDLRKTLPLKIRNELIASWAPPGWLRMEAILDPVRGTVRLSGQRWALRVTYGADFGGPDIKVRKIHSPYPIDLFLERDALPGMNTAWGAARKQLP